MMSVDTTLIDDHVAKVQKKYGESVIRKGSEFIKVNRVPFPSYELNLATGGGVPFGRTARFYGPYQSGKSFTTLNVIKQAQNLHTIAEGYLQSEYDSVKRKGEALLNKFPEGLEAVLYNVEGSYDKDFAQALGVDIDRLYVIDVDEIETMGTQLSALLGSFHLHVIDSVGAAASVDELSADISDWQRGLKARSWGKSLDHIKHHMDREENIIIMIDQVRVNMYTGAKEPPGGEKLKHEGSMNLEFKRGSWLYNHDGILKKDKDSGDDNRSGQAQAGGFEMNAYIAKSRVGRGQRRALCHIKYDPVAKFDLDYELAKLAVFYGFVKKAGSWFELPSGEKVQGEPALRVALNEDVDLKFQVQDTVEKVISENP